MALKPGEAYTGQSGETNPQLQQTRQQIIAAGHSPEEVDAFIANEGGNRVSDQRLMSAFGVGNMPGTDTNLSQGAGGAPGADTGGVASMGALNKVVEPSPDVQSGGSTNASLAALSSLTGSGGGGGNQEHTGSVADQSGGLYRALGRRNLPNGSLVLSRRAY